MNNSNLDNSFFDLQVNGYSGVDFNQNDLTLESLHYACKKLKEDGLKSILATIITADFDDMKYRLNLISKFRKQDKLIEEIIYGFHIEGPFLNKEDGFGGAHPSGKIMPADIEKMRQLLDAAEGLTRLVTLAPEIDSNFNLTKMLSKKDIVVAAGHCNPTLGKLEEAIDSGLSMFTHFGNGCPTSLDRHDNILQRVLSLRDKLWICFIVDGIHIPFFVLKNYLDLVGYQKSIVITDSTAAAGINPGKYTLSHLTFEVGQDRIVREPGKSNFAGSAITMKECKNNLINIIGMDEKIVAKLTYENPMAALGIN